MKGLRSEHNVFCDIGRALTSSLQRAEVLDRVMELIGRFFRPQHWSLLLLDADSGRLRFEIVKGADASKLTGFSLGRGEGIAGWVCRHGEPVVVEDVHNDPRFSPAVDGLLDFVTRSVVCVPVTDGRNRIIGALELVNRLGSSSRTRPGRARREEHGRASFDDADMRVLSAIAAFAGIAMENADLHERVQEMATVDALTSLKNRLYFNEAFAQEVERVRRFGQVMCLLMIDIDGLKRINDSLGHQVGDEIIVGAAEVLRASVRAADTVARVGGDEFVVLMPLADRARGNAVARRIQAAVADWNATHGRPEVQLGLSIGVQEAGPGNVENVLVEADRELYRRKHLRAAQGLRRPSASPTAVSSGAHPLRLSV